MELYPSSSLKFKSSDINHSIPCPSKFLDVSVYKSLQSKEFKRFFYKNLHSDYFIKILLDSSNDDNILLEGIEFFSRIDKDIREAALIKIEEIDSLHIAGYNVINNIIVFCF